MKWVISERPKIDRIAYSWLVARFIGREPEFLFAPRESFLSARRPAPFPMPFPASSLPMSASCAISTHS
jgi:hypothetical protein